MVAVYTILTNFGTKSSQPLLRLFDTIFHALKIDISGVKHKENSNDRVKTYTIDTGRPYKTRLPHFMPVFLLYSPEKKTTWFSDIFRRFRKKSVAWNGLRNRQRSKIAEKECLVFLSKHINALTTNVPHHIEISQVIFSANQFSGFYIMGNSVH